MTLNFEKIKNTRLSSTKFERDTVFEFIRIIQNILPDDENPYYIISELIQWTILTYFHIHPEHFTFVGPRTDINPHRDTVTRGESHGRETAYGHISACVSPHYLTPNTTATKDSMIIIKYVWTLKIISIADFIAIGIDASNKEYCDVQYQDCGNKSPFYAYELWSTYGDSTKYSLNVYAQPYGTDVKPNDIIRMELDVIRRTLQFWVNNEDQGVAFRDLEGDKIFNLAVNLNEESGVQIMDYFEVYGKRRVCV